MISPELLRRFSCFAPIREESLKAVAVITEEVVVPAKTRLWYFGDPADKLSLIIEGEVEIQYQMGNDELRTVDTLVKGDLLGWPALIAPYKMTCIATTSKDTRLIKVDAKRLRELCEQDPQLGHRLMTEVAKLLAERLDGARVQLAAVA